MNPNFPTEKSGEELNLLESEEILKLLGAIARTTYGNIFVIDYVKDSIEYSNPLIPFSHCGILINDLVKKDKHINREIIASEDQPIFDTVKKIMFSFYDKLPYQEKTNYTLNFDIHLLNQEKKEILTNCKITPFEINQDGTILKAICNISLSLRKNSGNIQMTSFLSDEIWFYDHGSCTWTKKSKKILNPKDVDVFRFYLQGLTISEIADKINLSSDTVKWHRRKLFEKLNVKSLPEALSYALTNDLI